MRLVVLIDFGSTYTKVVVADLDGADLVSWSQAPTTVSSDVILGLKQALANLGVKNKEIGQVKIREKLACSSAAGGLRIVSIGLVPSLTVEAATRAALGAGGKVVGTYSYELTEGDIKQIEEQGCDIVLLAGGTDGGDKDTILHNAKMLSKSKLNAPILVAGNRAVRDDLRSILDGKDIYITENVLPTLDNLNVEPVRSLIRQIFMTRIVEAKGMDRARQYVSNILMPTPMAVLKAARLLANGTEEEDGLGELILVDVGGATTDVHSIARGYPTQSDVTVKGLPEPYAKRTVEGDLGIRYNAGRILEIAGEDGIKEKLRFMGLEPPPDLNKRIVELSRNISFTSDDPEALVVDAGLAYTAIKIAMERHAGVIRIFELPSGQAKLQYGKDLTGVRTVIGTGGVFTHTPYSEQILSAVFHQRDPFRLKPREAQVFIDKNYILYGVGLLADIAPTVALQMAKKSLTGNEIRRIGGKMI